MARKKKNSLRQKKRQAKLMESLGNPAYFQSAINRIEEQIDHAENPNRAQQEEAERIEAARIEQERLEREAKERAERLDFIRRRRIQGGQEAARYL